MGIEEQLELAATALNHLEALHAEFMNSAASLKEPVVNGAELKVVDDELHATCLGIRLRTKHRPIVHNDQFDAIEYAFLASCEDQDVIVWTMYLRPDRSLYADLTGDEVICQCGNTSLTSRIAPRLASSLMKSQIFAPTE